MENPFVMAQLRSDGNPNPPGRAVGPGKRMPVYQGLPGLPWNAAQAAVPPTPRTQKSHIGMPSNGYMTHSMVARPWKNGYQDMIREGQIIFSGRSINPGDNNQMVKQVVMQQLQEIMTKGRAAAVDRLRRADIPDGINITWDQYVSIKSINIHDYLGREETIPNDGNGPALRELIKLIKVKEFKYLCPEGVLWHWNMFGGVNNISYGTSPEVRMDQTLTKTVVVNSVVSKRVFLSNIWGGSKQMPEGAKLGIILKMRTKADGTPGACELIPWALRGYETPPLCDLWYEDDSGFDRVGYFLPLGHCSDQEGPAPAEQKRRIAVGNGSQYTLTKVFDALGGLSQCAVQIGIP